MNNEEKILQMLTEMKATQEEMKAEIDKRFDGIEERLDELDARSLRSAVLLETDVARDIRLVYEGQEMLRQKMRLMEELTPKGRVEAVEDDVAVLKDAYKLLRMEVNELKKAQ